MRGFIFSLREGRQTGADVVAFATLGETHENAIEVLSEVS